MYLVCSAFPAQYESNTSKYKCCDSNLEEGVMKKDVSLVEKRKPKVE